MENFNAKQIRDFIEEKLPLPEMAKLTELYRSEPVFQAKVATIDRQLQEEMNVLVTSAQEFLKRIPQREILDGLATPVSPLYFSTEQKKKQWFAIENRLQKEVMLELSRSDLPAVAGSPERLLDIPGELLGECGLPSNAKIISDRLGDGYEIRIQSSVPAKLTMIFLKDGQTLYIAKISEQIPDSPVPFKVIREFTEIRFVH